MRVQINNKAFAYRVLIGDQNHRSLVILLVIFRLQVATNVYIFLVVFSERPTFYCLKSQVNLWEAFRQLKSVHFKNMVARFSFI